MNALLMNPEKRAANPACLEWRSFQPEGQIELPELLKAQQAHLAGRVVAVFGLGAVGGRCWLTLARLGVGTLIGADPDSSSSPKSGCSTRTNPGAVWSRLGFDWSGSHDQVFRNQAVGRTCNVAVSGPALVTLTWISTSWGSALA